MERAERMRGLLLHPDVVGRLAEWPFIHTNDSLAEVKKKGKGEGIKSGGKGKGKSKVGCGRVNQSLLLFFTFPLPPFP
jgi:hypothetical protein